MDAGSDYFWRDLDTADPLNQEIWDESVTIQLKVGPPERLYAPNSIGAQQAMIERTIHKDTACLPWVPDLLVSRWNAESAILIVGSAYAGFIREYSGGKGMPIAEYLEAYERRSVKLFIDSFKKRVIPEWPYYNFTRELISGLRDLGDDVAGFALFDVCRASFVCRSEGIALTRSSRPFPILRKDRGGDGTVRCQPAVFSAAARQSRIDDLMERVYIGTDHAAAGTVRVQ